MSRSFWDSFPQDETLILKEELEKAQTMSSTWHAQFIWTCQEAERLKKVLREVAECEACPICTMKAREALGPS